MNRQSEFPVRNAVLISIYLVCIYSYSTLYVQYSRLQFGRCWLVQHLGRERARVGNCTIGNVCTYAGKYQTPWRRHPALHQSDPSNHCFDRGTDVRRTHVPSTRLRYIIQSGRGFFCFFEKLDGKNEKLQNVQYHYVRSVRSNCSRAELIILRACQYVVPLLLCRRT